MPSVFTIDPNINLQPGIIKPNISDTAGAPPPDNSEILKISEDVLKGVQYSFVSVASNPDAKARSGTLEETFQQAIQKIGERSGGASKLDSIRKIADGLAKAAPEVRSTLFGRYGSINSKDFVTLGVDRAPEGLSPLEVDSKLLGIRAPSISVSPNVLRSVEGGLLMPAEHLPARVSEFESSEKVEADFEEIKGKAEESGVYGVDRLMEIWGPLYEEDPFAEGAADLGEFEEQALTDKLAFYIPRIKCVDETNPEWWGHDEIGLAGVTVDEDGDTKKIGERYIGGGFDDGDQKTYSPHWRYTWFNMREEHGYTGTKWPKAYSISLILAEKDYGGLSSALNTIWLYVRDRVKAAIANAVGEALSGWLGPVIARAIGQAVAWIIDKLIGWIISWFKDDIFPVATLRCTVPSYYARWTLNGQWGSTWSGSRYAHFYGHGGHYYVEYYWKLFA
jgi:hypothetical protein